jgi:hypothetical protein
MNPIVKLLFVLVIAAITLSCERQNANSGTLSVSVASDMVCKSSEALKNNNPVPESSCIRYSYDGDSLLSMTHFNAGFNCCPEKFAVDIEVKGDSLIIREGENRQGCKCNCLYNLDIKVHNLPADTYHVRIAEPYVNFPMPQLIFDIDLKKVQAGEFCATRAENWWR